MTGAAGSPTARRLIFSGGIQIPLHVDGRNEEQIRNVIETAAGVVGRQKEIEIHLFRQSIEREKIPDRVFVFRAAQAVEQREFSGIRLGRGGAVEFGFEIGCDAAVGRFVRPG